MIKIIFNNFNKKRVVNFGGRTRGSIRRSGFNPCCPPLPSRLDLLRMNAQWQKICNNLQKRLNPGSYKVWIEPLRASISADKIELAAPSAFVANWIRERLFPHIIEAATEVCGHSPQISIHAENTMALIASKEPSSCSEPRRTKKALPAQDDDLTPPPAPKAGGRRTRAKKESIASSVPPATEPKEVAPPSTGNPQIFTPGRPFPVPAFSGHEQQILPVSIPLPSRTVPCTWRYAFESFVVGPANNMAYAAARDMARTSAAVDMLFLSSGPGLGKTHLTQAVGHALCSLSNRANPRVEYLTAEEFSSCFVRALRAREMDRFKGRFRDLDLLLLEDVHFLQGKEKMQDEVLSTIKTLQRRGGRVVLTSSFAPRELKNVDSQLVSRFCSGFLAGIEKPDAETRRRILMEKAREREISLADPVADLLAERLTGDIRQMESCVHTLILKGQLLGQEPSLEMAREILTQYAQETPLINIDIIIRKICEGFALSPEQLRSRSRKQDHVLARNTIFYLARRHTPLSLQDIGDRFNRRHSTVLKGIAAVERELRRESSLGRQIASTLSLVEHSR